DCRPQDARDGRALGHPRGQAVQVRHAGHRHHRLLDRVERDRGHQPRGHGVFDQTVPCSPGARRRRQGARGMIQLSELTKSFGGRTLIDSVTWQIDDRERVGLCGPNGAGKTTLLRMMAGLEELDSGAIVKPASLTVGYLPQDGLTHQGRTVFAEASSAFEDLLAIKADMHGLEERLGESGIPDEEHQAMLARYRDRKSTRLNSSHVAISY